MKAIFSLRRHHYLKTVSIFLIAVMLIVGVVSCEGEATYDLTMAAAPAAGGTATDETGTSPYTAGTVVAIKAVAADCYRFDSWTAPSGTLADPYAAVTNFTMPAEAVTVTANFEPIPPDHFKFYEADWPEGPPPLGFPVDVQLVDQFGTFNATVGYPVSFGNPVEKVHGAAPTPIVDMNRHYTLYDLELEGEHQSWKVTVNNQFQDDVELTVIGPVYLAVPTQKEDHEMPACLNHYLVYEAYGPVVNDEVVLNDQFIQDDVAVVYEPYYFANPVKKTVVGGAVSAIENEDLHWVLYDISDEVPSINKTIQIDNQFGPQTLDLTYPELLAVPSQKIAWEQPLDHFKTYWADWPLEPPLQWEPPTPVDVQLEDQFVTINATVGNPYLFANPTFKGITEEDWTPISDPDNHLTFYSIEPWAAPQEWDVTVNNQFGNDQVLRVAGPFWLAVPTGKLAPDWPTDLDHFLVYEVYYKTYPTKDVYIRDQFFEEGAWTNMYEPYLFAVPAQKIHPPGGPVTPIVGDDHLVFYSIDGIYPWDAHNLPVVNQFGEQYLYVWEDEGNFLGVPSVKTDVEGPYPYEPPP